MNCGVIVQARCASTRFPRKVLLPLPYPSGRSSIEHIVARVEASKGIDACIIATTTDRVDDEMAERLPGYVYRGHPTDVLDRYCRAAEELAQDVIVRLTGDNPCLMPALIEQLTERFAHGGYDYCCLSGVPLGLHAEIFTLNALRRASVLAKDPYEREHVTPFFYRHPELFSLGQAFVDVPEAVVNARLTLDYPSDYAMLNVIFARFREELFTLDALGDFFGEIPWLREVNRNYQKGDYDAEAQIREAIKLLEECELNVPAAMLRNRQPMNH